MNSTFTGSLGVAATIVFTVYGQLVLKWRIERVAGDSGERTIAGTLRHLTDLWIISGFAAAFVAALCWMVALSKLPLTTAYPFMSLSFFLVLFAGSAFLGEHVSTGQWVGILVVMAGLLVGVLA